MDNNEINKICPLVNYTNCFCSKDECAWWYSDHKKSECAINMIAYNLSRLSDTLENIYTKDN